MTVTMTNSLPNEDGRSSSCLGERVVDGVRVAPAKKCHQELAADGPEPSTVELWICRLREALHETQHNLQLIYRQLQLQEAHQQRQQAAETTTSVEIQRIQRSVAIQTDVEITATCDPTHPEQLIAPSHRYLGNGRCPSITCGDSGRYNDVVRLNDAWELAGLDSRSRMTVLGRHYCKLYRRHQRIRRRYRRLRRSVRRWRRRSSYLELQHQILLESIGRQVDDVASDWAGRLKGLLRATDVGIARRRATESTSRPPLDLTTLSSSVEDEASSLQRGQQPGSKEEEEEETNNSSSLSSSLPLPPRPHLAPFSLYRWYSSLSLKLSWLQTSHRTVVDNVLLLHLN